MHKIGLAALVLASTGSSMPDQAPAPRVAAVCFSKGEQISGMNKICYYDCLGSLAAITIPSYKLCPLTING